MTTTGTPPAPIPIVKTPVQATAKHLQIEEGGVLPTFVRTSYNVLTLPEAAVEQQMFMNREWQSRRVNISPRLASAAGAYTAASITYCSMGLFTVPALLIGAAVKVVFDGVIDNADLWVDALSPQQFLPPGPHDHLLLNFEEIDTSDPHHSSPQDLYLATDEELDPAEAETGDLATV